MGTKETMRTTFAAREFTNDPVPDDVIYTILEHCLLYTSDAADE